MTKFAKLFDTPHGQLLVFIQPWTEGQFRLTTMAEHLGDISPSLSFDHKDEETATQLLNGYDQGKADMEANQLRSTAAMVMREDIK
jgi:hypothetical protein